MGVSKIRKIRINKKDTQKGFYTVLLNGPANCFRNNEYVIPDYCLKLLRKEKIKFKVLQ